MSLFLKLTNTKRSIKLLEKLFELLEIDEIGLTDIDKQYLEILGKNLIIFQLELAQLLRQSPKTSVPLKNSSSHIYCGLDLLKTTRGRVLTPKALSHLKIRVIPALALSSTEGEVGIQTKITFYFVGSDPRVRPCYNVYYSMFIDEAKIMVKGGHGGAGRVAFFRNRKGPSGGNGGPGGDVYAVASGNLTQLATFISKSNTSARMVAQAVQINGPVNMAMIYL